MKYKIIRKNSYSGLEGEVNSWIEKGWEPIGGVSILHKSNTQDFSLLQAMVYEERTSVGMPKHAMGPNLR